MTESKRAELLKSDKLTVAQKLVCTFIKEYPAEALAMLLPCSKANENDDLVPDGAIDMITPDEQAEFRAESQPNANA